MTSYRDAGVDIDAGNEAVRRIRDLVRSTYRPEVLGDIGLFGGFFRLGAYRDPVLVASADGVGTKLRLALLLDRHDTIGVDLVNHCVNDILTSGAEPLFFLDYFATGKLRPQQVEEVVRGLTAACRSNECALLGGETAEMPGFYQHGEYDVAGFIVGVVERDQIIDGRAIAPGDTLLGLPSSGLHTNGYSLARKVLELDGPEDVARERLLRAEPRLGRTLAEGLLEPHRTYWPALRGHLGLVNGLVHVTGGGFLDNLPRILAPNLGAQINRRAWMVPPIFRLIQEAGEIDDGEMFRVFNMGIGMIAVATPDHSRVFVRAVPEALEIGAIVERTDGAAVVLV